jgi:hypothetical protein
MEAEIKYSCEDQVAAASDDECEALLGTLTLKTAEL